MGFRIGYSGSGGYGNVRVRNNGGGNFLDQLFGGGNRYNQGNGWGNGYRGDSRGSSNRRQQEEVRYLWTNNGVTSPIDAGGNRNEAAVKYFEKMAQQEADFAAQPKRTGQDYNAGGNAALSKLRDMFVDKIPKLKDPAAIKSAREMTASVTEMLYRTYAERDIQHYNFKDSHGRLATDYGAILRDYDKGLKPQSLLVGEGKGQYLPLEGKYVDQTLEELSTIVSQIYTQHDTHPRDEAGMKADFDKLNQILVDSKSAGIPDERTEFIIRAVRDLRADIGVKGAKKSAPAATAGEKAAEAAKYFSEELEKAKTDVIAAIGDAAEFTGEAVATAKEQYAAGLQKIMDAKKDGKSFNNGSHSQSKAMLVTVNIANADIPVKTERFGTYTQPKEDGKAGFYAMFTSLDGTRKVIEPDVATRGAIFAATMKFEAIEGSILKDLPSGVKDPIFKLLNNKYSKDDIPAIQTALATLKERYPVQDKAIKSAYDEMLQTVHDAVSAKQEEIKANAAEGLNSGADFIATMQAAHPTIVAGRKADAEPEASGPGPRPTPVETRVVSVTKDSESYISFMAEMEKVAFDGSNLNPPVTNLAQALNGHPSEKLEKTILTAIGSVDKTADGKFLAVNDAERQSITESLTTYYNAKVAEIAMQRVKVTTLTGGQKFLNGLSNFSPAGAIYTASNVPDPDNVTFERAFEGLKTSFGITGYEHSASLLSESQRANITTAVIGDIEKHGKLTPEFKDKARGTIEKMLVESALESGKLIHIGRASVLKSYFDLDPDLGRTDNRRFDFGIYTAALESKYANADLVAKPDGFKGDEKEFRQACLTRCFIQSITPTTPLEHIHQALGYAGTGITKDNRVLAVSALQAAAGATPLSASDIGTILKTNGIVAIAPQAEIEQQVADARETKPEETKGPTGKEGPEDAKSIAKIDLDADDKDLGMLTNSERDDVEPVLRLMASNGVELTPKEIAYLKEHPELMTNSDVSKALKTLGEARRAGDVTQEQFANALLVAVKNMGAVDSKTQGFDGDVTDVNQALASVQKAMEIQGDPASKPAQMLTGDPSNKSADLSPT